MSQPNPEIPAVTNVPLLDLKAQYATIRAEIEQVMREVCDSQRFVMGPKVIELEERIAAYCGAAHGVGVSSGTDALLVALMALDIGPGDEVITTPFTFFATGGVVARLGARPVFCDIEPDCYNLDPSAVERFLEDECETGGEIPVNKRTNGKVRALMPVHLFGQSADMQAMMQIADKHGLRVVEDAAQAIGSEDADGRRVGSIGDIGCFSFFPSKNLGAFGDGGMCTTNDAELAEKMRVLRMHGGKPKYYHSMVGGNFRLDALQAAILLVKLDYLDDWSADRQTNASRYDSILSTAESGVKTPFVRSGCRHIYNQYTIRVQDRDGLRSHLAERNVGSEVYYPVPLHLQECFKSLGYKLGDCLESEAAASHVVSIPVYPELTTAQQDYVVESIREFMDTAGD